MSNAVKWTRQLWPRNNTIGPSGGRALGWQTTRTARPYCPHRQSQSLTRRGFSTVPQSQPYSYKPLQTNEVRILELLPGHHNDSVSCALRNVALHDAGEYESLSYFWGTRSEKEIIQVDDGSLDVTKSLSAALRHLRYAEKHRALWIDAICINQPDLTERGLQVGLMKQIYQLSERTVVWLGEEGQNSSRAVELILQLAKSSRARDEGCRSSHASSDILPLYDPAWIAFADLLQRPWWHRAWIVQEVSVAKDILLVCGNNTFTWDDLERAVQHAVDLGFFIAYGGSTISQAFGLFQTRTSFQKNRRPTLHDVLLQHRSCMATDSRDKVFGFLPLAEQNDVQKVGISPNYHHSAEHLFNTITVQLLKRDGLGALKASGIGRKVLDSRIPSWVADWSDPQPAIAFDDPWLAQADSHNTRTITVIPEFQASGSTTPSITFTENQTMLGLEGILIDQLEAIGKLSKPPNLRHVSHMFSLFAQCHAILTTLVDWERPVARLGSSHVYPTGERLRSAYWYTLCAGRVPANLRFLFQDPRYKFYVLIRSLRRLVALTIPYFPRRTHDSWLNRAFYKTFRLAWRIFGITPAKMQRVGFPPESRVSQWRRMARTQKGYLALAPSGAEVGDWVVICKGGKMPYIVRPKGEKWLLVGESYVHGIMRGEEWNAEKCQRMWFV